MKRKSQPFTKKHAEPAKNAPKTASRQEKVPISFLVAMVVLPTLFGAGIAFTVHTLLNNENQARLSAFVENALTHQVTRAQQQLEALAPSLNANPSIIHALETQDAAALKTLSHALTAARTEIASALLAPMNSAVSLKESDPTVSFSTLDILRRLEKNEPITLAQVNGPEGPALQHGALLHNAQGNPVGSVILTLNYDAFTQFFLDLSPEIGRFTLLQQTRNKEIPWNIGSNAPLMAHTATRTVDTNGDGLNDWRILYTIDAPLGSLPFELALGLVSGALLGGLLALLKMHVYRRLLTSIETNLHNLITHIKEGRSNPSDIGYTVDGFEAAHRHLRNAMDSLEQKQAVGKSAPPPGKASTHTASKPAFNDQSLLDMDLDLADDDLFESVEHLENPPMSESSTTTKATTQPASAQQPVAAVPAEIFRQYDIRGIVDESLTPEIMALLGKAIATACLEAGDSTIVVGRDGRLSSPALAKALCEGIQSTGCHVIDIGTVPTPLVYFAAKNTNTESGVMITGSHNPPNYNGLKIVIKGHTIYGDQIQHLHTLIQTGRFAQGAGKRETLNIANQYVDKIGEDIAIVRPLKVVVDAGNGVAGPLSVSLLRHLNCEVIELYCDIDGNFPNHHPDPSKLENLSDLIHAVAEHQADLGLAFDGDGDRLGVVTPNGKVIFPDRLLMLYARDILSRNPGGEVIFDIKCTSDLNDLITSLGGRPIMWKTGHSLIKAKLKETGALIAGEMSGHIFFNDRWYGFDDALYSAVRLLEILSVEAQTLDGIMDSLPEKVSTPEINIPVTETSKFEIIEALTRSGEFQGNVITLDGIRVDYKNGWGLVRASNTTPNLVARFEADTDENLRIIQNEFKTNLLNVNSELGLPF